MSKASERLAKGTLVYMIGNIMSKVLQMIILPIVTASLHTSEYGYYDLIVTTISLVTPIVTFQLIEGMFRYMFEAEEKTKKKTVSTVTFFLICSFVVLAGILLIINYVVPNIQYTFLIYLNYVSAIIFNYMQKLARCQQKNRQFAVSGVLNTIVMLGCQALTLLVFHMKVDGMLIANCVSYFVASMYLVRFLEVKRWIDVRSISRDTFKSLFKYSAPLIPNSIGWWVVSSSDKYVITLFMDTAANGIYSIAGKFSQLLTFVTSVFQLAWQESAIMEEKSETRDAFYTDTFNTYMRLLMGGYVFILPFIRIIIPILLSDSYQSGFLYNPILLIGAIMSAFSQFYGSAYMVFKRTSGAFSTTVIAAIINLIVGAGLIKWLGLFAPALGTTIAFGVQWIVRAHQLRDCFRVHIEKKTMLILCICMMVVIIVYYIENYVLQLFAMIFGLVVFCNANRKLLTKYIYKVLRKR